MPMFGRLKEVFHRVSLALKAIKGMSIVPLEDAIGDLMRDADMVHLGDTDHRDKGITDWLAAPEHLRALHERGVRTLFMEVPRPAQPCVPLLVQGKLSPADFGKALHELGMSRCYGEEKVRNSEDEGRLIANAGAAGIKVVFADSSNASIFLLGVQAYAENACLGRDFVFVTDAAEIARRTADVPKEVLDEYQSRRDAWVKLRTDDTETAAFMKEAAEGKSLILYGAAHDFRKNFADLGISARKLSLFPKAAAWAPYLEGPNAACVGDHLYLMDQGAYCPRPETPEISNDNRPPQKKMNKGGPPF
jgi:hypothetical protein